MGGRLLTGRCSFSVCAASRYDSSSVDRRWLRRLWYVWGKAICLPRVKVYKEREGKGGRLAHSTLRQQRVLLFPPALPSACELPVLRRGPRASLETREAAVALGHLHRIYRD